MRAILAACDCGWGENGKPAAHILMIKIYDRKVIDRISVGVAAVSSVSLVATGLAGSVALTSVGGGMYEFLVVDPFWPKRPDLIQPDRGGISRRRFWIPAHVAFELLLLLALVASWPLPDLRMWLLCALASHLTLRIGSAFDFIPKALAFEGAMLAAFTVAVPAG